MQHDSERESGTPSEITNLCAQTFQPEAQPGTLKTSMTGYNDTGTFKNRQVVHAGITGRKIERCGN